MLIENLSSKEKDMLISEMYPVLKVINETAVSIEDLNMFAEFCTITGLWGEHLKRALITINPNIANYNEKWSIDENELIDSLNTSMRRQRLAKEMTRV